MDILVAGEKIWCRLETLRFVPNSALAALANHNSPIVDRPAREFRWLIDWCRTMGLKAIPTDPECRRNLLVEADYWGIEALKAQISNYNQKCGLSPLFMEHDTNRAAIWCRERHTHSITHIQLNNGAFMLLAQ